MKMRYLILSSIILICFLGFASISDAYAATWYNSSWLKARKITVDDTDITADLTNYPLYVNLTSVNIGTDTQADCDDFVFTNYYNTTKLNHEVEHCSDADNWAEFWVNVPTVFNANATVIYMYYNNAAATDQQNTQATWNSNYKSVLHLNGTFIDSTSTPTTCTNSGSSALSNDYVGDARTFDGIDDYINCGSDSKTDNIFDAGGTISFWSKEATDGENGAFFVHKADGGAGGGYFISQNADTTLPTEFFFETIFSNSPFFVAWTTNSELINTNKWQLFTVTYDDDASTNDPILYVNGTSQAITQTNTNTAYISDASESICIGNQGDSAGGATCNTTFTHDGSIDEIRYYDAIASASWIKADWECQRGGVDGNSCITLGSQGTEPAGGGTATVSDEGAGEDTASAINTGTATVSDEGAGEDVADGSLAGIANVSDEGAGEDMAGTNLIIVSDEGAGEDTVHSSQPSVDYNTLILRVAPPTTTRLGGVFSGVCDFGNNYTQIGIYNNGTIRCAKVGGGGGGSGDNLGNHIATQTLLFKIYSDATRPACNGALQGGVIFNTTDLNLNICNGANWILPDGTVT